MFVDLGIYPTVTVDPLYPAKGGAASATAATFQTPDWVTAANTASAVKITFGRK